MSRSIKRNRDSSDTSSTSSIGEEKSGFSFKKTKCAESLTDDIIISKIPVWPEKMRFMRAKGVCNPGDNKLVQYSVLGTVAQNWLSNSQYSTRTLAIEGPHVEKFLLFLKGQVSEFKDPDIADTMYLKCKESDPLLIADQDKSPIGSDMLSVRDRVLCTFSVTHWQIKKMDSEGFKFHLISVRHLPVSEELAAESDVYCGPDF